MYKYRSNYPIAIYCIFFGRNWWLMTRKLVAYVFDKNYVNTTNYWCNFPFSSNKKQYWAYSNTLVHICRKKLSTDCNASTFTRGKYISILDKPTSYSLFSYHKSCTPPHAFAVNDNKKCHSKAKKCILFMIFIWDLGQHFTLMPFYDS